MAGAAVSVAIMATHHVARQSPQQYLHYISVQVVDVIANSHSDHQSHIWPRVVCGGIRACWRIEGSTGASALPRVTNDHAECCCWWEYRLAPHFSVFSKAYLHPELGALLRRVLHLLLIVGAHCCGTLPWKRSVCRVCAGVALSLVRSRAAIVFGPGNRSYLLFVAMSYAYLFKYIIIGDMGECWLPSVSPLLRVSPAVFHGVVQVWANHAFSYNSRTSDSSQFTI